jgi:hypothetical protein
MTGVFSPPPPSINLGTASILERIKEGYLGWLLVVGHIPKGQRYTIGVRIENKYLDLLESARIAYFLERDRKAHQIAECVLLLDSLKYLIHIAWEAKLITHTQYASLAEKLEEIGKMFGGWRKSLDNPEKKNRTL